MSKPVAFIVGLILLAILQIPNVKQAFFTHLPFTRAQISAGTSPQDGINRIQMALLLDTSNSMDGLIEQTKSQLWKMVNELASTTKNGATPEIEIALYEYGNSSLSVRNGYVKQVVAMTSDLDLISEKLFQLRTNGGEEYCGYALKNATLELNWSDNPEDLKIMVIAGNESYTQGPISFQESCRQAKSKGIIINTIFCGDYQTGIRTSWKEGAECANGQYLNINHNDVVEHIPTPYDQLIIDLNIKLNKTYLGYGIEGEQKQMRQMVQDDNAAQFGKSNARVRASFKSKKSYNNSSWDLVDAYAKDESVLSKNTEELPQKMQGMTVKERGDYVLKMSQERTSIQKEIQTLNKKAETYVAEQKKDKAEKKTLDNVMIDAIKQQAQDKRFKF